MSREGLTANPATLGRKAADAAVAFARADRMIRLPDVCLIVAVRRSAKRVYNWRAT